MRALISPFRFSSVHLIRSRDSKSFLTRHTLPIVGHNHYAVVFSGESRSETVTQQFELL